MKKFNCVLVLFVFIFSSCEVKVKTGDDKTNSPTNNGNTKIRNNIKLQTKGLEVEQAFLLLDDGSLVGDDNKIKVNDKVNLRLIISRWKEENGHVFLDTDEKITTSDGDVLIDEKNLFAKYDTGVLSKDAEYVTLMATITQISKLVDYFLVSFRVWDKKGGGEIVGSYKLYLK
jgi:hypothetical protein